MSAEDMLRAENTELRALLDDATGQFRHSDHLAAKWAHVLRREQRRVQQLRSDLQAWQDRAFQAERELDRARHELNKAAIQAIKENA